MPTKTEIIEAGAQVLHDSKCGDHPVSECARTVARQAETLTEAALEAMLPLIKEALAAEVRKHKYGINDWSDDVREHAALIVEGYEPAP